MITPQDWVKYQKQSSYIKEFKIPLNELGLKGITTDPEGNVWLYHSTNKTSTILMFDPKGKEFRQFDVESTTKTNSAIISLAGGQLVFDNIRSAVWFTDARTNSIGKLDIKSEKIQLFGIPTPNSGPMGIVLSPDKKMIWFTEITGNKIASLDLTYDRNIINNSITEYSIFESQEGALGGKGPTLLTFDKRGVLWVTMSYSNDILRVEPWALVSTSKYNGMYNFSLPKPDTFSPFGITVIDIGTDNSYASSPSTSQGIFLSDHGSNRVILAFDNGSNPNFDPLQNYTSYWTSPSQAYPQTLPSQIVSDKAGNNIYFAEHGGNRISKIDVKSGIMTEYDIPTGPLSTAVFLAISDDSKKVWFTEYAANKIAYLDTTIPVSFQMHIAQAMNNTTGNSGRNADVSNNGSVMTSTILKPNERKIFYMELTKGNKIITRNTSLNSNYSNSSSLSLNEIELSIIGTKDSGLVQGLTYQSNPPRINMLSNPEITSYYSQISLSLEQNYGSTSPGKYTAMIKSSAHERNESLFVSLLYPINIVLDIPISQQEQQYPQAGSDNIKQKTTENDFIIIGSFSSVPGIIRTISFSSAIGLTGYIVYRKIRSRKNRTRNTTTKQRQ
ncbi:MAG: virginiamycin B lyase family protein [Nitrososphaeraceae archaeon]